MELSPIYYGLNSRTKLKQIASNNIGIIKRVKSRIIQKDAIKIIEIANAIRKKESNITISLICNDNICSKSIKLLNDQGIDIQF